MHLCLIYIDCLYYFIFLSGIPYLHIKKIRRCNFYRAIDLRFGRVYKMAAQGCPYISDVIKVQGSFFNIYSERPHQTLVMFNVFYVAIAQLKAISSS